MDRAKTAERCMSGRPDGGQTGSGRLLAAGLRAGMLLSALLLAGCSPEGALMPPAAVEGTASIVRPEAAAPAGLLAAADTAYPLPSYAEALASATDADADADAVRRPQAAGSATIGTVSLAPDGSVVAATAAESPGGAALPAPGDAGLMIEPGSAPSARVVADFRAAEDAQQGAPALAQATRPAVATSQSGSPAPLASGDGQRRFALLPRLSNPLSRPEWAGGLPAAEKACRQRLKRLGVTYRDLPPIRDGKRCGIAHPIELTALSGNIRIKPAATLNCQITEAFARWVKNELAPAARTRYLSGIDSITQLSSYSCRTMNSRRGAPMSEHASGNAIDIGKITLGSGKVIDVRRPGFFALREKSLLKTVRSDSCRYFTTVLGPGSDRYHKDHFHFDLRSRNSARRHCD